MRPGLFAVKIQTRSVGADVDGAQAHAAAGFDPLLLIAVAHAGVDVDAAEAEAVTMTPTMAPMAVMEAAGGSGRGSGEGQRGGGDQSEGNFAKHSILQLSGAEAVVASLHLCRSYVAIRSRSLSGIVFPECFVAPYVILRCER